VAGALTQTILTHDPNFGRLGREIARFANHTQRFVRASQNFRDQLQDACEWSDGVAPLSEAPVDVRAAFDAIDNFARKRRENRANLAGAYFAHHYLRQQAMSSRRLLRASFQADPKLRLQVCREVYIESGAIRRAWVGALLEKSLRALAPDLAPNRYVALNVGALTDHEDVDLAVVVADPDAQEALARGFAGVAKTFVRFASKIQMFLTEGFAQPTAGGLLSEYGQLLEDPARNVVSATQLLGAQVLCGNEELFEQLREEVTSKYFAGTGNPIVHEGYLRALMAELKVHLRQAPVPGVLAPKREIYVPSKLACTGARVIANVDTPLVPLALEQLGQLDPALSDTYDELSDVFVQIEVLRALMFLYVFSGDEIVLSDDVGRVAVRRVALLFGLGESARRTPEDRLLGTYVDLRSRASAAVKILSRGFERHLERISTFRRVVDLERNDGKAPPNIVHHLLDALERHRGSVFWDDVVDLITGSPERRTRFLEEVETLSEDEKRDVARRYVTLMVDDAAPLIEFLVFLATRGGDGSQTPEVFWQALRERLSGPGATDAFLERLDVDAKSEALFRLATAYPPQRISNFADFIEQQDPTMRSARAVRTLRSVVYLVHHRSNAIGRITNRVLARTPEFLRRLGDTRRLKALSNDILESAAREPDPRNQIEILGDSFDVAVLRASLVGILEGAPSARDHEFTEAVDRYVRELFKACFREVRQRSPMFEFYRPGFGVALFATGGYGRGEAFGGDFDYIAVVEAEDRGLRKFFGKVLQRMSMEMTRRGLHPHNRHTDLFNSWAVSVPELAAHMKGRGPESFIDEAEVVEARFCLGDAALAQAFKEEIKGLILGPHRGPFIRDVLNEIRDRRPWVPEALNLKEGRGGLRELHLLFLAIRVFARTDGPFKAASIDHVEPLLPGSREDLEFLVSAHHELRRFRELYRLSVAFDDHLDPAKLEEVAKDLAPLRRAGIRGSIRERIDHLMREVSSATERVSASIARAIAKEA
jgi:hypothetical protein